ncbi:MAG: carbohydrate kinase family protein [Anaerolineae bacterium]
MPRTPHPQLDVVGLGYCSYDILALTPEMPEFDAPAGAHLDDLVTDGGGPVGTALVALARLGARAGYVGLLGDDAEGRWLREQFVHEGVDVTRLRTREEVGTNLCLVLVDGAGRRAILCQRRVSAGDLSLTGADRVAIQGARVLHLDGQFLPAAIQAARWMREAGGIVCFDGFHLRPGLDELLPLVDWLVVAESFPARYTGGGDPEAAARELLALGPELLVVTMGQKGSRAWTKSERLQVPAFPVQVVDTTGAGDAFHGGLIYGMLQAWGLERVLLFASAVAGLNCQTLGGRRGLPALDQVEALLRTGVPSNQPLVGHRQSRDRGG